MTIGLKAVHVSYVAYFLAVLGAILVLVWCISFRGGLAWEASNKSLIFNICLVSRDDEHVVPIARVLYRLDSERRYWEFVVTAKPSATLGPNLAVKFFVRGIFAPVAVYVLFTVLYIECLWLFLDHIHPVLMLIGFIIIGGQAIMSYKTLPLKKPQKKLVHLVLHAIALGLGIIGIYTAFKYHNESNIANLYSLHSWLGIGVISLYGIQWLVGFVVFFFPGGTPSIRRESLPWHVLFGMFVYILAVGTASLGYLEKLTFLENSGVAKYGSEAFLVNFTAIVTILYGSFVIFTILSQAPPEEHEGGYTAI